MDALRRLFPETLRISFFVYFFTVFELETAS
jgi:hypothetical protein